MELEQLMSGLIGKGNFDLIKKELKETGSIPFRTIEDIAMECNNKTKQDPQYLTNFTNISNEIAVKAVDQDISHLNDKERDLYKNVQGELESKRLYQLIKMRQNVTPDLIEASIKLGANLKYSENGVSMLTLAIDQNNRQLWSLLRKYI